MRQTAVKKTALFHTGRQKADRFFSRFLMKNHLFCPNQLFLICNFPYVVLFYKHGGGLAQLVRASES